jgi:hypothetical protein
LPRKSYSISYKIKVLSFCDLHGRKATIQEFHIDSSLLFRWLKAHDSFESSVDQTPVWWNGMTSNTRTVAVKNQRLIFTRCPTAANSREKVSVILACYRDGRKLPPAIIV